MFKPKKKNTRKKKLPTYILNINSYALPPPPFTICTSRRPTKGFFLLLLFPFYFLNFIVQGYCTIR